MGFRRRDEPTFSALPPLLQDDVRDCGLWLIGQVVEGAARAGTPLTSWDTWVLEHELDQALADVPASWSMVRRFAPADGQRLSAASGQGATRSSTVDSCAVVTALAESVERCVDVTRALPRRPAEAGSRTVTLRPGATISSDWLDRCEVVSAAELPWAIVSVVESATATDSGHTAGAPRRRS